MEVSRSQPKGAEGPIGELKIKWVLAHTAVEANNTPRQGDNCSKSPFYAF